MAGARSTAREGRPTRVTCECAFSRTDGARAPRRTTANACCPRKRQPTRSTGEPRREQQNCTRTEQRIPAQGRGNMCKFNRRFVSDW
jgi:hypothetical protein